MNASVGLLGEERQRDKTLEQEKGGVERLALDLHLIFTLPENSLSLFSSSPHKFNLYSTIATFFLPYEKSVSRILTWRT